MQGRKSSASQRRRKEIRENPRTMSMVGKWQVTSCRLLGTPLRRCRWLRSRTTPAADNTSYTRAVTHSYSMPGYWLQVVPLG